MSNKMINLEEIFIGSIPTTIVYPKSYEGNLPVIFIYHGWSSQKSVHENLGTLLACYGYFVVIPEAINHGSRGSIDYWDQTCGINYFWPTVENSIKEYPIILDYILNNYSVDENRVGITGHSMGAITTSGILAHHKNIKAAVTMDGSGAWKELTLNLLGTENIPNNLAFENAINNVDLLSPLNNINNFKNTPLLLLHGEKDTVVPIKSDKIFYNALKDQYDFTDRLNMVTFDRLNHYVTQAYINELISWFNKYL